MSFVALHSSLVDECKLEVAADHIEETAGQCPWVDQVAAYLSAGEGCEGVACLVGVVAGAWPSAVKVRSWSVVFGEMMMVADFAGALVAAVRDVVVVAVVVWQGSTMCDSRSLRFQSPDLQQAHCSAGSELAGSSCLEASVAETAGSSEALLHWKGFPS